MTPSPPEYEDFPAAFEAASADLLRSVRATCAEGEGERPLPERTAAGIRAALQWTAAEPESADLLTNGAMYNGFYGATRYHRLLDRLGRLLAPAREAARHETPLPDVLEQSLVGGIAIIVAERLQQGRTEELRTMAPEATEFLLTPYVGPEEAKRLGAETAG